MIARADGTPVYHLAVVVDDHDAGITHVVRGADHYSNTPKHVLIQRAMGIDTPVYAHLPLLHGPDGKKLSKRHGAASVQELRDSGYLPEAVRNYLALLGWGYDDETTFFTTDELQRSFSLEKVSKSPAVFDEQKLRWMNGRYLRELPLDELTARLEAPTGHSGLRDAVADHAGEDLDARRVLAARARLLRGAGRTTPPPARSSSLPNPAQRRSPPRARRSSVPTAPGRTEDVEPALRAGGRALRHEGQAGFPAITRRAHGHDDLPGDLRDGRADRARALPGADRRGARPDAAAPDRP